jgi:hypothetical protein
VLPTGWQVIWSDIDFIKIYKQLVEAAAATPLYASYCVNSTDCITPVSASNLQTGMQNALQGDPDFPIILEALFEAQEGDASLFALAASIPITSIQVVWAVPILCGDYCKLDLIRKRAVADLLDFANNTFESFQSSVESGSIVSYFIKIYC